MTNFVVFFIDWALHIFFVNLLGYHVSPRAVLLLLPSPRSPFLRLGLRCPVRLVRAGRDTRLALHSHPVILAGRLGYIT